MAINIIEIDYTIGLLLKEINQFKEQIESEKKCEETLEKQQNKTHKRQNA